MLTCKQFLQELNDYLDPSTDPAMKCHLEKHVNECPNCFVIVDTTKKTMQIYKGLEAADHSGERKSAALEGARKEDGRPQVAGLIFSRRAQSFIEFAAAAVVPLPQ